MINKLLIAVHAILKNQLLKTCPKQYTHARARASLYIYIYIYELVCVCVCVCWLGADFQKLILKEGMDCY